MDENQFLVLGWICIALFGGAALIWLADMVGWVTIREAGQRKMLNSALGVTLIGGIASFAATTIFGDPSGTVGDSNGARAKAGDSTNPNGGSSGTPFAVRPSITPTPTPVGPPGREKGGAAPMPDPLSEALPNAVVAFLRNNNLLRPTIAGTWSRDYPECAEKARTDLLSKPIARGCFGELGGFNTAHLVPYQEAYDEYVPAVAQLSYSQPDGEVLEFLRQEASDYTMGTGVEAARYREVSTLLDADYATLRKQAY